MGGYVALEFWRRHRRRLRALLLCDTRAAADAPEVVAIREQTAARLVDEGTAFLQETMLPRLLGPAVASEQPRLVDRLRRIIAAADPRGLAAASRGMARRADFTPLLPAIDCPTLLIVGREDVVSPPAEMAAMAAAIPGGAAGGDPRVRPPLADGAARGGQRGNSRFSCRLGAACLRTNATIGAGSASECGWWPTPGL